MSIYSPRKNRFSNFNLKTGLKTLLQIKHPLPRQTVKLNILCLGKLSDEKSQIKIIVSLIDNA